jgi:hypothetical protein
LQIADIGHSSKTGRLHMQWSKLIVEEFFQQGDKEKAGGMKASAFMDRDSEDTPKNQVRRRDDDDEETVQRPYRDRTEKSEREGMKRRTCTLLRSVCIEM